MLMTMQSKRLNLNNFISIFKDFKTNFLYVYALSWSTVGCSAKSAGVVEYTDCISAEG